MQENPDTERVVSMIEKPYSPRSLLAGGVDPLSGCGMFPSDGDKCRPESGPA
jgi:hypothetical protein